MILLSHWEEVLLDVYVNEYSSKNFLVSISFNTRIATATVSRILTELEKMQLVTSTKSGRSKFILPTMEGREVARRLQYIKTVVSK